MKKLCLLVSVFSSMIVFGNDINYAVNTIPDSLLKGANMVMRSEDMRLEVHKGEMVLYRKYALTILNESAAEYAWAVLNYDKFRTVRSFEGSLYDAYGKSLKKVKNKDVQDVSAVSDISLYDDSRRKVHNFNHSTYPYTVEYEMELKISNTYSMPSWFAQRLPYMAVEKSSFTLIAAEDYKLRFKTFNIRPEPAVKAESGRKGYLWQARNLRAITPSYASPLWHEMTAAVYPAPEDFEMEGYKGNSSSWEQLGKFALALNEGRDKVPEDILAQVRSLTKDIADEKEKVKVLYHFLQKNTRYISIQRGIGGLQPFDAAFVAKKGYGDCKALSNYMFSLLKAVNIRSHYTLVKAGSDRDDRYLLEDFPLDQFNHIILCVPFAKDTMWLECTSQTTAPGYMGAFTGNRKALLITDEGGKLVATPRYGVRDNVQSSSITGKISLEGNLELRVKTSYMGTQQDDIQGLVTTLSPEKVKKYLNERLDLSTYDVNDFNYKERPGTLPAIDEQLAMNVSGYAAVSGKRIFIFPNVLNRSTTRLNDEERIHDFVFGDEHREVDSVVLEVPPGYTLEAAPSDISLKSKYGLYTSTVKLVGNQLFYQRVREFYAGRYGAAERDAITAFFETIYKGDRNKVVLVKKEN
jgi:transglutaminase-like putative cysteine protease